MSWATFQALDCIVELLTQGGEEARIVGGCLRNSLAGQAVGDIDIATPIKPEQVAQRLTLRGIRFNNAAADHGTVVAWHGSQRFEITTLRLDVEHFGRRAKVVFTRDWLADARRRDFTFNAMSSHAGKMIALVRERVRRSPCSKELAYQVVRTSVIDPFGGLADLEGKRVRFIGEPERRMQEDLLRLLRFFRFHAHYGQGSPEAEVLQACRKLAPRLGVLSPDHVRCESLRLLAGPAAADSWEAMTSNGVLAQLLPVKLYPSERLRNWCALEDVLGQDAGTYQDFQSLALRRLACLIPDLPSAEVVAQRLFLSRSQKKIVLARVAPQIRISHCDSQLRLREAICQLGDSRLFIDLLMLGVAGGRSVPHFSTFAPALQIARSWDGRAFPLGGDDLLRCGMTGPEIGRRLSELKRWWAACDFRPDKEAVLAELRRRLERTPEQDDRAGTPSQ